MTDYREPLGKAAKDFLAEAEEILEQLGGDLLALGECADRAESDPETVNSIFRSAHSLKGLAGMFGFTEIAELSHNLESLLDCLRLGRVALDPKVLSVLFDAVDVLGAVVRGVGSTDAPLPELAPVLERIGACISGARRESAAPTPADLGISEKILQSLTEYEEHRLRENIGKGRELYLFHASYSLDSFDRELGELVDLLKGCGEVISTLPSAEGDMGNRIAFDILFGTAGGGCDLEGLDGLEGVSVSRLGAPPVAADPVRPEPKSPVPSGETAPAPAEGEGQSRSARSVSKTMRVDIAKLDELMNIVGELILSHGNIAAITDRLRSQGYSGISVELGKAAKGMERKLNELQKRVMEVRMVPVGQLFEKMSRIVRKISREQEKRIELRLAGTDTELDKMIVEDITDPLMHIIRNSLDHGIEPPAERRSLGKDETGLIRLSSYQKGNHVVIEVDDDGRGFDLDRITGKALELGVIESAEGLSDREILDLIFLPGFSTAEQVSDVSGRGVGMDVVRNNISAISGTVEIESERGVGSRVVITLPITLAIIKALLVETSGRTYGIPVTSVRETISLEDTEILTVEQKEVIQLRESTLPLLHLERFFDIGEVPGGGGTHAVVAGEGEKRVGIVVDELLGQQDIVIKSLGETFKGVKGIAGAADLGNQHTILVLDMGGIIAEVTRGGA